MSLTDWLKMFFLWKSRLAGFQSFVYWLLVLCTCKVRRNYFADILRYFTTVHHRGCFSIFNFQQCKVAPVWYSGVCNFYFLFAKVGKSWQRNTFSALIRGSEWDIIDIWVNFWIKHFCIRMIMMGGGDLQIVGKAHIPRLCYFSGLLY